MSFLLAVSVPCLLMIWTYGMQRLEGVIHSECPKPAELVTRIESAARAARDKAVPLTVLSGLSPRMEPAYRLVPDEPGLPTRPNPVFKPSEYASSV